MTTATDLLNELTGSGIAVSMAPDDPDALDLDGPAPALTLKILESVKAHKPALLALLRSDRTPDSAKDSQGRPVSNAEPEVGRVGQPPAPEPPGAPIAPHEPSLAERIESGYVNPGWTARAWAKRLCQLAERCEALHPQLAAQYRTWAEHVWNNRKKSV